MRQILQALADALRDINAVNFLPMVEDAANGSDEMLNAFLVSNNLWGGSGSIADCGGLVHGKWTAETQKIEHLLIQLGEAQIQACLTNVRTEMWVGHFRRGNEVSVPS